MCWIKEVSSDSDSQSELSDWEFSVRPSDRREVRLVVLIMRTHMYLHMELLDTICGNY